MVVGKGTVGVWNGTSIRLFRVERETATGPSLTRPLGAVDAVGSRLVSGVKSLGGNAASRVGAGETRGSGPRGAGRVRDV